MTVLQTYTRGLMATRSYALVWRFPASCMKAMFQEGIK